MGYTYFQIDQWLPEVDRVEVIDENGRSYMKKDSDILVSVSIQDNGKTLKVFVDNFSATDSRILGTDEDFGIV